MTIESQFVPLARRYFDFLITDFNFVLTDEASKVGEAVRYDNPTFYISISFYKGEIDVVLWVKVDTQIIRPASPRVFYLQEILPHLTNDPFRDAPHTTSYRSMVEERERWLEFYAKLLQKYCAHILRGDLSLLELLSKRRGG